MHYVFKLKNNNFYNLDFNIVINYDFFPWANNPRPHPIDTVQQTQPSPSMSFPLISLQRYHSRSERRDLQVGTLCHILHQVCSQSVVNLSPSPPTIEISQWVHVCIYKYTHMYIHQQKMCKVHVIVVLGDDGMESICREHDQQPNV